MYTSEHLSLAMVEYLVHLDPNQYPRDLVRARADVPDDLNRLQLWIDDLPKGWQDYPAPQSLAAMGEVFVRENQAAVLIIPSVVASTENNWLLKPNHPDFRKITLGRPEPFRYDPRPLQRWTRTCSIRYKGFEWPVTRKLLRSIEIRRRSRTGCSSGPRT